MPPPPGSPSALSSRDMRDFDVSRRTLFRADGAGEGPFLFWHKTLLFRSLGARKCSQKMATAFSCSNRRVCLRILSNAPGEATAQEQAASLAAMRPAVTFSSSPQGPRVTGCVSLNRLVAPPASGPPPATPQVNRHLLDPFLIGVAGGTASGAALAYAAALRSLAGPAERSADPDPQAKPPSAT